MPNANRFELETCLRDCLRYCEEHEGTDVAQLFHQRFVHAAHHYTDSIQASESSHVKWRTEEREELVAWKQLSSMIRDIQTRLRRMGAIGAPERRVLYWDRLELMVLVEEVVAYLGEHSANIEWASGEVDKIERLVGAAKAEGREEQEALKAFQRNIDVRRESMTELGSLIGEFRVALRRTVGKRDDGYNSIHWPFAIASDENILF